MNIILHITTGDAWRTAVSAGVYVDPSLDSEGFIHCSTPVQVARVADERFRGRSDLLLLSIDADRLKPALVFEDSYGAGETFPHLYGPLNLDAVVAIYPFPPGEDGRFRLPRPLQDALTRPSPDR